MKLTCVNLRVICMRSHTMQANVGACLLLLAVAEIFLSSSAFARGGAPNLMNSPGYQRALEESRKRFRQSTTEPYVKPPAVYPRKTWKSRGRR